MIEGSQEMGDLWKIRQLQKLNWVVLLTSWPWYSGDCGRDKLKARSENMMFRHSDQTRCNEDTASAKGCNRGLITEKTVSTGANESQWKVLYGT